MELDEKRKAAHAAACLIASALQDLVDEDTPTDEQLSELWEHTEDIRSWIDAGYMHNEENR